MTAVELDLPMVTGGPTAVGPTAVAGPPAPAPFRVGVLGGGASGVLAASHLLRASRESGSALVVDVFEPAGQLGRGRAYGTTDPDHLLNVPAGGMSAWPDRPTDFAEWAARTGVPLVDGFAPRRDFGRYLRSVLANAVAAAPPGSLRVRDTAAVDIEGTGPRTVVGADGTRVEVDLVVLATGWAAAPEHADLPSHKDVRTDPLAAGALENLPAAGDVVILGAGLSGIDAALSVLRDAPGRRVVLVSRSGELPRAHTCGPAAAWTLGPGGFDELAADGPLTLPAVRAAILAEIAAADAAGVAWQAVMDAVKPQVARLWLRLPDSERAEFLATELRRWDVHRHRMAPSLADAVEQARASGRLRTVAGRPEIETAPDGGLRVLVRADDGVRELGAVAVLSCRGWGTAGLDDVHGLGRGLQRRGTVVPDSRRLSLDTTVDGHVLDSAGRVAADMVAIGPARRGVTWESTAIGAIREQAAALATAVVTAAAEHPVGAH